MSNLKIEVNKVYSINGQQFSSKEEAIKNAAMNHLKEIISLGVDEAISKSEDFIKTLKQISTIRKHKYQSGTLKQLSELLERDGLSITRDSFQYSKYCIDDKENSLSYIINCPRKLYEIIEIYESKGLDGLLKFEVK